MKNKEEQYREWFRMCRHQLERIQLSIINSLERDEPLNEHDIYITTKHILKETPSIDLRGDANYDFIKEEKIKIT